MERIQDSLVVQLDSMVIDQKSFDEANLEACKKSGEFDYEVGEAEPTILERFSKWIQGIIMDLLEWLFDDISPAIGVFGFLLKLLPWIVLGVALFLVIRYFVGIQGKSGREEKEKSVIRYSDDEELIKRRNLKSLLKKALEKSDFRMAVRFSYLIILKRLSESKLIDWQQEKTNEDYIKELRGKKIKIDFEESTYWYDFVWYGNFDIDQTEFEKANILFNRLIDGKLE